MEHRQGEKTKESAVLVFPINFVSELDGLSQQRMLLCCQSSRKAKIRISFGKLRKSFSAGKHMVLSLFGLWENFWNTSAVVLICSAIIENTHQFMVNATFKFTWVGNPFALNDFPIRCSDVKCAHMTLPSQFQVRVSKVSKRDRRTIQSLNKGDKLNGYYWPTCLEAPVGRPKGYPASPFHCLTADFPGSLLLATNVDYCLD